MPNSEVRPFLGDPPIDVWATNRNKWIPIREMGWEHLHNTKRMLERWLRKAVQPGSMKRARLVFLALKEKPEEVPAGLLGRAEFVKRYYRQWELICEEIKRRST